MVNLPRDNKIMWFLANLPQLAIFSGIMEAVVNMFEKTRLEESAVVSYQRGLIYVYS